MLLITQEKLLDHGRTKTLAQTQKSALSILFVTRTMISPKLGLSKIEESKEIIEEKENQNKIKPLDMKTDMTISNK